MSASEKLRALDGAIQETLKRDGDERHASERIDDYLDVVRPLRNALPLIADVIEAAESVTFFGQPEHRYNEWHGSRLVLALTALREHLGETT